MLHTITMIANSVSDTIFLYRSISTNESDRRLELLPPRNGLHSFSLISRSDLVLDLIVEYTEWLGMWSVDWDSLGLEGACTIESRYRFTSLISALFFIELILFCFSWIKLSTNTCSDPV